MRRRIAIALSVFFIAIAQQAFATCHAVGPSATGNGSGSDWNNRMGNLPATLVRSDTYYLADGTYGSYRFGTPNSGSTRIIIKKAQAYDFGRTSDSCSNDISAGWNAPSMGNGQATFTSFDAPVAGVGYLTLDGNGSSSGVGCGANPALKAAPSDCGIKLASPSGNDGPLDIGANGGGAVRSNGWTISFVEWQGAGDAATSTGEQNGLWCRGGCDALTIEKVYWHDSPCNFIKLPWANGAVIRDSYYKQNYSSSSCHGQYYMSEVSTTNVSFYGNVFSDIQGTGVFSVWGGAHTNYNIYNNVFLRPQGSTRPGLSNGVIACIHAELRTSCNEWNVIGNSFVNLTQWNLVYNEAVAATYAWKNNLFYGSSGLGYNLSVFANGIQGSGTNDNTQNTYLNSGSPAGGMGTITVASGAASPFVDWPNNNFNLVSSASPLRDGAVLSPPFNVDAAGVGRPGPDGVWNRGAYQFNSVTQRPQPPSGLVTNVR